LYTRELKKLKDSEGNEVFRAQGSVGILDVLMRVKEDIRRYEKDLREGKVQPLKEGM